MTHNILLKQTEKDIREAGLRLLKYRMRSKNELKTRLLKKGFSEIMVQNAIMWFENLKFINDEEFAKCFAEEKVRNKKIGAMALKSELFPHHLDEDLVDRVISKVYTDFPEEELIRKHIQKKRLADKKSLPEKDIKKISGFLKRKGFRWDTIRIVLSENGWV